MHWTDEQIADLEAQGYRVTAVRDSKDDQLRDLWDGILKQLRMAEDIAANGGKLTVRHGAWLNANADPVKLLRDGVVRKIDAIFENAIVERREMADAAE